MNALLVQNLFICSGLTVIKKKLAIILKIINATKEIKV